MPRVCALSGKKTRIGRQYTTRGLAKSKGGVGIKTTGKTARKFKANIQRIRVMLNGRVVRMKVAAKFIRRDMIEKPVRRQRPGA
ncbi:MAG: 50S ribosomal protein L28 [Planctomycetota bacterium]